MKVRLSKVTIIAEGILKSELISLVRKHGATGHTITKVEGQGSRGARASDWEGRNVRIETIVSSVTADAILEDLAAIYFEDYAVVAWLGEVDVLRGEKFVGDSEG